MQESGASCSGTQSGCGSLKNASGIAAGSSGVRLVWREFSRTFGSAMTTASIRLVVRPEQRVTAAPAYFTFSWFF
jgi:hypothetical protein